MAKERIPPIEFVPYKKVKYRIKISYDFKELYIYSQQGELCWQNTLFILYAVFYPKKNLSFCFKELDSLNFAALK